MRSPRSCKIPLMRAVLKTFESLKHWFVSCFEWKENSENQTHQTVYRLLNSENTFYICHLQIRSNLKCLNQKDLLWFVKIKKQAGGKKPQSNQHPLQFQGIFIKRRAIGYFSYCVTLRKNVVRLHLKGQMPARAEQVLLVSTELSDLSDDTKAFMPRHLMVLQIPFLVLWNQQPAVGQS